MLPRRRRTSPAGDCTIPRFSAPRRLVHVEAIRSIHRHFAVGRRHRPRCSRPLRWRSRSNRSSSTMRRSRCRTSCATPQMTWLQQNFGRAKAVIIAPEHRQGRLHLRRLRRTCGRRRARPEERQVARPRVLHDGDGERRLPGRHFGVGERHAGDDRQGLQLAPRDVVQDGRRRQRRRGPGRRAAPRATSSPT